ncbi:MAG: type II toxin-antitoxin system Phd/YefM family antitoxin [Candidatus Sumerlaeota bacterium]|nr:type II toxin-antitoxin system Phd/YefM family antitoxin [Candidatus Sumerlaeota bacterium]
MTRMTVGAIRAQFADAISQVAFGGERIVLNRHGKDVAALVSVEDLAELEALENQRDLEIAEKRMAEFESSGEPAIPLEEVAREFGISLTKDPRNRKQAALLRQVAKDLGISSPSKRKK